LKAEPHSTGTNSCASAAHRVPHLVRGERFVGEVLLQEVVVDVRDRLEQLQAGALGLFLHVRRDVDGLELRPFAVVVERPHQGLHLDQVDDAAEFALRADGELDDGRVRVEAIADHLDATTKPAPTGPVDEAESGTL
jgi:hypothetical protein